MSQQKNCQQNSIMVKKQAQKMPKYHLEEQSDYSIGHIRKCQKRIHKKRVIKIIHTCCIVNVDRQGRHSTTFRHITSQTTNKDYQTIKKNVMKTARNCSARFLEEEKEKLQRSARTLIPQYQNPLMPYPYPLNHPGHLPFGTN